ncbi:cAMP-dependent protein kinase [Sporobolomyces koalae]|uniref:cAMP-dependent protein kinase n=1 Tax=Sporobolomyces koalae TaxID=500713 RepID=UPI003171F48A
MQAPRGFLRAPTFSLLPLRDYFEMDRKRSCIDNSVEASKRQRIASIEGRVAAEAHAPGEPFSLGLQFPPPPSRLFLPTSHSDEDSSSAVAEADPSFELLFDPVAFIQHLTEPPIESPVDPSFAYRADFASLPADFQALENPYLPQMASPSPSPSRSPVPDSAASPARARAACSPQPVSPRCRFSIHDKCQQAYLWPVDTRFDHLNAGPDSGPACVLPQIPLDDSSLAVAYTATPMTAFSTPALSPETMSLSSSQDHGTPAPFPSPQVYLQPLLAPGIGMSPYEHIAIDEGHGLGLQSMNFESMSGADYPPKRPPALPRANPALARATRAPPPDLSRKGMDIGLTLADFDMLDTLGTGTFGKVLPARLRMSSSRPSQREPLYFAMKILEKSTIVRLRQVEHVNSERSTLALIQHPFIVNLFCTFQDEQNLYLLLEYVQGGELFSHLRRAGRFTADVTRFYIANLVLALEHLHRQDIIYRDLKPENLLIGADGHIKVTDFGFAKYVPDRTHTLCGTPEYLAPEIITATGHGAAADWWALGILLFELLAGYPPFYADHPLEIYEKILAGKFSVPPFIDPVAKDLIRRLLTADLTKRLGNLSGGAQDVKAHPWFEGVDWIAVSKKHIRAPIIPETHIPGDSSNFERFPVADLSTLPGIFRAMSERKYGSSAPVGPDPYGYLFPNF